MKKEKEILSNLKLYRTVGLELEGYFTKVHPRQAKIRHSRIKQDGSLNNASWSHPAPFGVEVVTEPLDNVAQINLALEDLLKTGWSVKGGKPGLHVHVDARDFNLHDRLKAMYFAKRMENIMFLFTKNSRWKNRYCRQISDGWRDVFANKHMEHILKSPYNLDQIMNHPRIRDERNVYYNKHGRDYFDVTRYQWLNMFRSSYSTIEFRIFHGIRSAKEAVRFAYLAHNFVATIKHSTIEQLQFIADSIDNEPNLQNKVDKFLKAIGVPFHIPIINRIVSRDILLHEQWKKNQAKVAV